MKKYASASTEFNLSLTREASKEHLQVENNIEKCGQKCRQKCGYPFGARLLRVLRNETHIFWTYSASSDTIVQPWFVE